MEIKQDESKRSIIAKEKKHTRNRVRDRSGYPLVLQGESVAADSPTRRGTPKREGIKWNEKVIFTNPDSLLAVLPPSASDVFGIMLYETDDSTQKSYIGLLADEQDPDLFTAYKDYFSIQDDMAELNSFKEVMSRTLRNLNIDDAYTALSDFWSQQTPERWTAFLNRMLSDVDYMNTDNSLYNYVTMTNFVQNRLGQYGDTTLLGDYYDAMDSTTANGILNTASTTSQRAQIYYAAAPEAMFEAMKGQAWFAPLMEKAMKASTSISFTNFAFDLSSNIDIGLSVSAFLVPKIREDHYYLAEHHMYGSSRLGIKNYWSNHYAFHYDYNATNNTMTWAQALDANQLLSFKRPWYSQKLEGLIQANETVPYGHLNTNQVLSTRQLGLKQYELTNHLGNVMAVVTDKLVDSVANANATTDPLPTASIRNAWASASYDYYPFGMLMPERYTEDKTVQCTPVSTPVYYPYWIDLMQVAMDDPIQVNYFATTNTMDVMEVNADNQKLYLKASPTGEEQAVSMDISSGIVANMLMNVSFTLSNQSEHFTSIQIQQQNANMEWETLASTTVAREADVNLDFTPANTSMLKLIIKGHDMDVIVGAIKYKRLDLFGTSVVSTICNSSEFDDDYRFGFNGQMKDNEIKGIGNSLSFLHRIYDSRLGKFLSVDPLFGSYPWNSSYAFAENDVIRCIDLEGLERLIMTTYLYQKNGTLVKLDQGIAKTDGNWKGDKYRESYFFEGKKHKDGSYAYYSEGGQDRNGTAMMNMHKDNPLFFSKQLKEKQEAQEKFNKCTKDVLTITGGVIAIIATGGAVLAVEGGMSALTALGAAWSLTSAEIAVTGGVTKLALDLNGNKASEKIPTSLGGAVGLTVDYTVGNKNGKFQAMGDIADGILTFNIPKNLTQGANATLSITNIALAVPDATKSEKK